MVTDHIVSDAGITAAELGLVDRRVRLKRRAHNDDRTIGAIHAVISDGNSAKASIITEDNKVITVPVEDVINAYRVARQAVKIKPLWQRRAIAKTTKPPNHGSNMFLRIFSLFTNALSRSEAATLLGGVQKTMGPIRGSPLAGGGTVITGPGGGGVEGDGDGGMAELVLGGSGAGSLADATGPDD